MRPRLTLLLTVGIAIWLRGLCTAQQPTWSTPEVADPGKTVGMYASIALDSQNRPHIAYYDSTNGDLKYAQHNYIW